MAEIERMAALCMKDLDDEEMGDEDLDDDDLLVTHEHTHTHCFSSLLRAEYLWVLKSH